MFDYIIIGAGFSGLTVAECLATQHKKRVLIIDKRNHVGGNCYDSYNEDGLLIHNYGPRVFHTNDKQVWDYISQFTSWKVYQHKTVANVDGLLVSLPISLVSVEKLFVENVAQNLINKLIINYGYAAKVSLAKLLHSTDEDLIWFANYLIKHVYANSIHKQYGIDISNLSENILDKIQINVNRDERHYADKYQGIPAFGYNALFKRMLDNPNIKILLNADYNEFISVNTHTKQIKFMDTIFEGKLVYTAKLDELFDYCYGELPYRTIDFKYKKYAKEHVQQVATIVYPNEYDFTRRTEVKYLTGQIHHNTVLVEEYHRNCSRKDIPYYPIATATNIALHQKYFELSKEIPNLVVLGSLASYHYIDMATAIKNSLDVFAQF